MTKKDFGIHTFGEAQVGNKQIAKFSCRPEDVEKVKAFLKENLRSLEIAEVGTFKREDGREEHRTRFTITQHKFYKEE